MNIERIKVYRKGLKVERLHTVAHLTPYNNGSHSANAGLIAHELCILNNMQSSSPAVVLFMLMHDIAEGYVGDMPANVKRDNPDLRKMLSKVEDHWEKVNLPHMPDLHHHERAIVKIADIVELGMYCVEELALGNTNLNHVLVNVINYLGEYSEYKGVAEFVEYFISRGEE